MKRLTPEQQLIALLTEVLAVAHKLVDQRPARQGRVNASQVGTGVYPHRSKYNPWRAYVWDTQLRRSIYLGAFPSVAKARAAQKAYRIGAPITAGTKAGPKLVRVA